MYIDPYQSNSFLNGTACSISCVAVIKDLDTELYRMIKN